MTLRDGKIVYELNGLSRPDWTTLPKGYRSSGDPRWDGIRAVERQPAQAGRRPARVELRFPANRPFPWRRRRLAGFETQEWHESWTPRFGSATGGSPDP